MEIDRRDFLKIAPSFGLGAVLGAIIGDRVPGRIHINVIGTVTPEPTELPALVLPIAQSQRTFLAVFDMAFDWLKAAGMAARQPNRPEVYFVDEETIDTNVWNPIISSVSMQRKRHIDGSAVRVAEIEAEGKQPFHEQFWGSDITSGREYSRERWQEISYQLKTHFEEYAVLHNDLLKVRKSYEELLRSTTPYLPNQNT